jgi:hypothetical protein
MKMFCITTKLCQFVADKNSIESEWGAIIESLQNLQIKYNNVLMQNLGMLSVAKDSFANDFTNQSDANFRYLYLTLLRQKAAEYVIKTRESNPKNWKESIYYQLIDIQTLKIKYGDITLKIRNHMDKYNSLVAKYKSDKDIGSHVAKLSPKLDLLKQTFDNTFEPTEYVRTAYRMYKVL